MYTCLKSFMKNYNFVYITTNLINGKQYVGDHSTNNLNDNYLGSGRPFFKRALAEYGKKNFKREILEFFDTKEDAFNAQEKYIAQFNTLAPNGYNISPKGGNGCSNGISKDGLKRIAIANSYKRSPESCEKMRLSKLGKKLSKEHKENISKSGKGRIFSEEHKERLRNSKLKENNPMFNRQFSEEHRKKLSEAGKGKKHSKKEKEARQKIKKIKCEHCGKEFMPWCLANHYKKYKI